MRPLRDRCQVSVLFEVCNPLMHHLEGMTIALGISGPAHPDGQQPSLVWKLPKVESQVSGRGSKRYSSALLLLPNGPAA